MSSTFHTDQSTGHYISGRRFSGFSTSVISAGMLVLGLVLGSSGWLDEERHPATGVDDTTASIAAPAGARVHDDWRGNSAGISGNRNSETR